MTTTLALAEDASADAPPKLPTWAAGLSDQPTKAAAIRFLCDRSPVPPTTDGVRQILAAAGIESTRPYASGVVSAWRKAHGMTSTGDVPVLSASVLADLDASAGRPQDAFVTPTPDASARSDQDASTAVQPDAYDRPQDATPAPAPPVLPPHQDASATAPAAPVAPGRAVGIEAARTFLAGKSKAFRRGFYALATIAAVLLTAVVIAPISLSAQNIIGWAADPTGLNLTGPWPVVVFFALDAAAAVCVLLVILLTMLGRTAREFGVLVWAFCLTSAWASYSHGLAELENGVRDAWWAMPIFSVAGVGLFELIMRRARQLAQEGTGRRADVGVTFPLTDWIPGVGALRETYGTWRLARLDGITDASEARRAYRALCPDGSVKVLKALRERDSRGGA